MEQVQAASGSRDSILAEIVAAYESEGRYYHGLGHVAALLALSAEFAPELSGRDAVDLAIIFHDAVYSITRSDNEEESARFARKSLAKLGFPPPTVAKVDQYVLATKHQADSKVPAESDLAHFLDFDLSILGADREEYAAYATAIRKEYAIYLDDDYRPGRVRVLRGLLDRQRIFQTEALYNRFERRARANLSWELGLLQRQSGVA